VKKDILTWGLWIFAPFWDLPQIFDVLQFFALLGIGFIFQIRMLLLVYYTAVVLCCVCVGYHNRYSENGTLACV